MTQLIDQKTIEDTVDTLAARSGLISRRSEHEFYCVVMPDHLAENYDPANVYVALNLKIGELGTDSAAAIGQNISMSQNLRCPLPKEEIAQGFRSAIDYIKQYVESQGLVFKDSQEHLKWARKG